MILFVIGNFDAPDMEEDMEITIEVNEKRITGRRSPMLYEHFIEHFHRQIYDGIYDPGHSLSDADGFRGMFSQCHAQEL